MPLQELVHKMEEVGSSRPLKILLVILSLLLVALAYDLRAYRNFSTQEAMDSAQLGRSIAQGRGFTTRFIRPFSMHLIHQRNLEKHGRPSSGKLADYAEIQTAHPDISNPPLYPVVLAGLMKVLPFDYSTSETKTFWSVNGRFWRYEPDFLIALFNQLLLCLVIYLAFRWAHRLFDAAVAWTSAVLLLGAGLLWQFSVSGLSTMLLLLIFMGVVWCLTLLEAEIREPKGGLPRLFALAVFTGALVGLGGLTRYSFAWLMLPVLIFVLLYSGPRRVTLALVTLAAFAVIMVPWIARNYDLSGTPFGTATYSVLEGTSLFPRHRLERSLSPTIQVFMPMIWKKLLINSDQQVRHLFTDLGGGWITAFFLVGLLIEFRNPSNRRLRYFLLMSIGLLFVVQALGSTQLAKDSPRINSENLLVLFLPLVVVYGVSLFFVLLDQVNVPELMMRYGVIGLFGVLMCLPMIFALLPPRTLPVVYPPYYPPLIQQTASWMKPNELMMSDVPWAVAWYGNRQCVWLTLEATPNPNNSSWQENFFSINDYQKPIQALYLTQKTMNKPFVSGLYDSGKHGWGHFVLNVILRKKIPQGFPLRNMPSGYLPEQLMLSDWKRWE